MRVWSASVKPFGGCVAGGSVGFVGGSVGLVSGGSVTFGGSVGCG